MTPNKFPSQNKIKGRLAIPELFKSGSQQKVFPLKSVYRKGEILHPLKIKFAVSVPKKLFKRAVDRNQIKRYLRESVRIHRDIFTQSENPNFLHSVMIIYISREMPTYAEIEEKIILLFNRLNEDETK